VWGERGTEPVNDHLPCGGTEGRVARELDAALRVQALVIHGRGYGGPPEGFAPEVKPERKGAKHETGRARHHLSQRQKYACD